MCWKCLLSAILVLQILTSMDVTVCVIQYYTDQWAYQAVCHWDCKALWAKLLQHGHVNVKKQVRLYTYSTQLIADISLFFYTDYTFF